MFSGCFVYLSVQNTCCKFRYILRAEYCVWNKCDAHVKQRSLEFIISGKTEGESQQEM